MFPTLLFSSDHLCNVDDCFHHPFICRLQKEKEDALADIDCKREQYDKLQVGRRPTCLTDVSTRSTSLSSLSLSLSLDLLTEQRLNVTFQGKDKIFPIRKMSEQDGIVHICLHVGSSKTLRHLERITQVMRYSLVMGCLYW